MNLQQSVAESSSALLKESPPSKQNDQIEHCSLETVDSGARRQTSSVNTEINTLKSASDDFAASQEVLFREDDILFAQSIIRAHPAYQQLESAHRGLIHDLISVFAHRYPSGYALQNGVAVTPESLVTEAGGYKGKIDRGVQKLEVFIEIGLFCRNAEGVIYCPYLSAVAKPRKRGTRRLMAKAKNHEGLVFLIEKRSKPILPQAVVDVLESKMGMTAQFADLSRRMKEKHRPSLVSEHYGVRMGFNQNPRKTVSRLRKQDPSNDYAVIFQIGAGDLQAVKGDLFALLPEVEHDEFEKWSPGVWNRFFGFLCQRAEMLNFKLPSSELKLQIADALRDFPITVLNKKKFSYTCVLSSSVQSNFEDKTLHALACQKKPEPISQVKSDSSISEVVGQEQKNSPEASPSGRPVTSGLFLNNKGGGAMERISETVGVSDGALGLQDNVVAEQAPAVAVAPVADPMQALRQRAMEQKTEKLQLGRNITPVAANKTPSEPKKSRKTGIARFVERCDDLPVARNRFSDDPSCAFDRLITPEIAASYVPEFQICESYNTWFTAGHEANLALVGQLSNPKKAILRSFWEALVAVGSGLGCQSMNEYLILAKATFATLNTDKFLTGKRQRIRAVGGKFDINYICGNARETALEAGVRHLEANFVHLLRFHMDARNLFHGGKCSNPMIAVYYHVFVNEIPGGKPSEVDNEFFWNKMSSEIRLVSLDDRLTPNSDYGFAHDHQLAARLGTTVEAIYASAKKNEENP